LPVIRANETCDGNKRKPDGVYDDMTLKPLAIRTVALLLVGSSSVAQQASVLLVHQVTVIDATGAPSRPNVDVLIRGAHVQKVASHIPTPRRAQVIPGRGKFLIPGLWDMHVHIWDVDLAFPLLVANGVTGVRNMGGHPDELMLWRKDLREGKRLGPRLIACGPVIDGDPPIHPDHSVVVQNPQEARATVDRLQAEGWDFLKVYDNLPRNAYFALADEAKRKHIPFVGHVPLSVTAAEASGAGQKSIEHFEGIDYAVSPLGEDFRRARLEGIGKPPQPGAMMKMPMHIANELDQLAATYDPQRTQVLFAEFKQNGTWQVPTLTIKRVFASIGDPVRDRDERLKYVSRQQRDDWEHNPIVHTDLPAYVAARKHSFEEMMRITREAHEAGVRFLAGTDSGGPYLYYGFSLHDELGLLVDAGFTPLQALRAATRDAAEFLGLEDTGTIESGKRADLVLLDANPLADIHNTQKIDAVILGGKLLDRHALDGLLKGVEQKAR
jgi:hypothetical protein